MTKKKKPNISSASAVENPKSWAFNRSVSLGHAVKRAAIPSAKLIKPAEEEEVVPTTAPLPESTVPDDAGNGDILLPEARATVDDVQKKLDDIVSDPLQNNALSQLLNAKGENAPLPIEPELSTGQEIARGVLRYPVPGLLLQDLSSLLLGNDSAVTTGISKFNEALPFGFGDEIQGAIDTGANLLTGNLDAEGIGADYTLNRDLRRENLSRMTARHPAAGGIGTFLGSLPSALALRGKTPLGRVAAGSGVGGAIGLGQSEADTLGGQFADAGKGAAFGGLLMSGAEGLGGLAKLLRPKNLDAIAAHNRIAGGGDANSAGLMTVPREGELPAAVKGFKNAEAKGLIRREGSFVTNVDKSMLPSSQVFEEPFSALSKTKLGETVRRKFSNQSEIDYDKLRADLGKSLSQGREEKLALLKPIENQSVPLSSLFGSNPTAVELRTANAIKALEKQIKDYNIPLGDAEANSLSFLKKNFGKENLTLKQAEELSSELGILTRRYAGKQFVKSSPQKLLKDAKIRIDNHIANQLEAYQKGSGITYQKKNQDLYNDSEFLDSVKDGQEKFLKKHGAGEEFNYGPIPRLLLGKDGKLDIGSLLGKSLTSGAAITEAGLRRSADILRPMTSWASQVFSSYDQNRKTVTTERDLDLYKHYIDNSSKLSPQQKARLKSLVNTNGSMDMSVVPDHIKQSAQEKSEMLPSGDVQASGLGGLMRFAPTLDNSVPGYQNSPNSPLLPTDPQLAFNWEDLLPSSWLGNQEYEKAVSDLQKAIQPDLDMGSAISADMLNMARKEAPNGF
jgi:hypothetical protein